MTKYKYRICNNEKFWFELLPNNNNNQPVAKSSPYNTYDDAVKGVDTFKKYVAKNFQETWDSENIPVSKNWFEYRIYFGDSREEFITTRAYQRFKLKDVKIRIKKNYLAPLRRDL